MGQKGSREAQEAPRAQEEQLAQGSGRPQETSGRRQ